MRHLLALTLLSLAFSTGCEGPAAAPDTGVVLPADAAAVLTLDELIAEEMARGGIPGLAAAVVRGGEVAWTGTYGFADVELARPVTADTRFILASVSKTFTVALVMQLVEDGLLDLDAPIDAILGLRVHHPAAPAEPITTRMLLAHVSGLEDDFVTLAEVTYGGDPAMTLAEFTAAYAVAGGALDGEGNWGEPPLGERSYCNAGYGLIGHIVEVVSGRSFRELSRERLFEPLGMSGAGWFLADVELATVATPYAYARPNFTPLPHNGFAFYPASSLRASVLEVATFARALLGGGAADGTRILAEDSVRELARIQYPALDSTQALTFSYDDYGGRTWLAHGGSTFGGSNQLLLDLDRGVAIVLLTNSDAYVRSRLGLRTGADAIDAILGRIHAEIGALGSP